MRSKIALHVGRMNTMKRQPNCTPRAHRHRNTDDPVNLLLFFNVDNKIAEVAQDAAAQDEAIDIVLFETIGQILYGCTMMVGGVFILLGAGVYQFPVAAPAIGLGLYVLGLYVLGLYVLGLYVLGLHVLGIEPDGDHFTVWYVSEICHHRNSRQGY
jgi:hypothetical protein